MPPDVDFAPYLGSVKDPCVRFCTRVHEWTHYSDPRPYNLHWDYVVLTSFLETPAYRKGLACLLSFGL